MVVPPRTWITHGEWDLQVVGPTRTEEVLEMEIWHGAQIQDQLDADRPFPDGTLAAEWCGHYIEKAHPTDKMRTEANILEVAPKAQGFLDRHFDLLELLELKSKIIDSVSLGESILEDLIEFWKIQFGGGCDCPLCEGRIDPQEMSPHVDSPCNFDTLQDRERTFAICSLYDGDQGDNMLDRPYFLYQIQKARRLGEAEAEAEAEEDEENVELAQEMTRERLG